jgi:abequosyltransferase
MSIKLSICIATLNRGAFIGETLRSIAAQVREGVEIVVLDGASRDNTEQVVRELQQTVPCLRYIRQDRNCGVDRDFNTVVELASGEYCWLMSDDDLLKPGAVQEVLRAIDCSYSLIIVNSEVKTFDFSRMLDPNRLRIDADRVYAEADFQRLFEETSAYLSYIGAVVIKKDIWLAREKEPYFGSFFIHVGVIFQQRLPGKVLVIAPPLITIRFGNAQWRPKEFEIRMIRWTNLIWSLPAVSEPMKEKCYPREPWRSIKSLLFYRAKGTYSMTEYRRWVKPQLRSSWDTAKALGIALFPGVIANLIGLVYCSFGYRDSEIHLLDMKVSRYYFRNLFGNSRP